MPRSSNLSSLAARGLLLLGLCLSAGCSRVQKQTLEVEVGHHAVQLVTPVGWEHLDHGRQQLFRHGEIQVSLTDLGIATQEGLLRDLRQAQALWRAGRTADATARVFEIRGPMFQGNAPGGGPDFWRPWNDAIYRTDAGANAATGAAFTSLIEGAAKLPEVTEDRLREYVIASSMDIRRREIRRQTRRTIHGSEWMDVETWDPVSHLYPLRLAWTQSGGYLLVVAVDRGPLEQAGAAFEALLTSIEIKPPEPQAE